jgi:hypothetical protein
MNMMIMMMMIMIMIMIMMTKSVYLLLSRKTYSTRITLLSWKNHSE